MRSQPQPMSLCHLCQFPVRQDLLGLRVRLPRDHPDHLDPLDQPDLRAQQDDRGSQTLRDHPVLKDHEALVDLRVRKECLGLRAQKDRQDQAGRSRVQTERLQAWRWLTLPLARSLS